MPQKIRQRQGDACSCIAKFRQHIFVWSGDGSQNISDSLDDFRYLRGVGLHPNGKLENDLLLVSSITADICGDMVTAARLATEKDELTIPAA